MGFEIRITGSTPLESLSALAAAASYCMYVPAIRDAANDILAGDKSAVTPGPQSGIPAPAGAVPAAQGVTPPPAGAAPAAVPGVVPNQTPPAPGGYPSNGNAPNQPPQGGYGYPRNQVPVGVPGGTPGNPMAGRSGETNPTTTGTSPSNPQQQSIPGMAPPAGNVPGPGTAPLPVSNAPGFTVAQVGKAGADLVTAYPAKRAELNALLQSYGVQSVSELRQEQLGPFAMALRGLGANI